MSLMADHPAFDRSPDRLAAEADRLGFSGRDVCVVLEGSRFALPGDSGRWNLSPGSTLEIFSGHESRALVLRPASGGLLVDPAPVVRTLALLGVKRVLFLADAEPIRQAYRVVEVVRDHVNLRAVNPLAGPNDERFGPRFPDMSDAYDGLLRGSVARALGLDEAGIVIASADGRELPALVSRRVVWSGLGIEAATEGIVPGVLVARHAGLRATAAVAFAGVDPDLVHGAVGAMLQGDEGFR